MAVRAAERCVVTMIIFIPPNEVRQIGIALGLRLNLDPTSYIPTSSQMEELRRIRREKYGLAERKLRQWATILKSLVLGLQRRIRRTSDLLTNEHRFVQHEIPRSDES